MREILARGDKMKKMKARCPRCGPVKPVPIMYGLPAFPDEAFEAERRGEVLVGGCVVSDDSPLYACPMCHEGLPKLGTYGADTYLS